MDTLLTAISYPKPARGGGVRERPCVCVRTRVCARVLGAVLCSQPFRRRLEAAFPGDRRPDGWCRRPLAGRPRAQALTGSLSCSGGSVRERRGGQAARGWREGGLSWGAQGWRVEWVHGQSQAVSVRLGLGQGLSAEKLGSC